MYVAQGVGRGVWESTNKSVCADMFARDPQAAFANVVWASAGASAFGYFVFGKGEMSKYMIGVICMAVNSAGLVGYFIARACGPYWAGEGPGEYLWDGGGFGEIKNEEEHVEVIEKQDINRRWTGDVFVPDLN